MLLPIASDEVLFPVDSTISFRVALVSFEFDQKDSVDVGSALLFH